MEGGEQKMQRMQILQQVKQGGIDRTKSTRGSTAPGSAATGIAGLFGVADFSDMFEQSPLEKIRDTGKIPDVADAFTYRSIHLGVLDGVYDFEQSKQLSKVGLFQERKDAYSRAFPVVIPPNIDKLAEVRAAPILDAMDPGSTGARPSTTGGISQAEKMKRRQNWRGYKNLVSEFDRSTKNIRRAPRNPAGIQTSGNRKGRSYAPPGSAPLNIGSGRIQTAVGLNTDLADKLEDEMSDSDDDEEEEINASRRSSSAGTPTHGGGGGGGMSNLFALTQAMAGASTPGSKQPQTPSSRGGHSGSKSKKDLKPVVKLHEIHRVDDGDSSRDHGIKSIAMDHIMDKMHEAEEEEDHTLMTGTHQDVEHKKHLAHKSYMAQKNQNAIVTEQGELTRKFSVLMNQKAQLDEIQRIEEAKQRKKLARLQSGGSSVGGSQRLNRSSSMNSMSGMASPVKPKLATKWSELRQGAFGPNYTLDEVKHFYSCFTFVDKDLSGEIDVDEWQEFLQGMDQQMSLTDARRLFMHIDANHNGVIDMSEICKVVFNRATTEQHKLMIHVMTHQTNARKSMNKHKQEFSRNDLRQLFRLYDENDEKRLSVKRLKTAFTILNIPEKVVTELFAERNIDVETGDIDAEEFTDMFSVYLKQLMVPGSPTHALRQD
jgi:Ca2+-binding EF-hand superfamily protein